MSASVPDESSSSSSSSDGLHHRQTTPAVVIRPATPSDRASLVAAHNALLEVDYDDAFFDALFSSPGAYAVCAVSQLDPATVVGFACARCEDASPELGPSGAGGAGGRAGNPFWLHPFPSALPFLVVPDPDVLWGWIAAVASWVGRGGAAGGENTAYIMTLGVMPKFRRRGIAALLLQNVCEALAQRGRGGPLGYGAGWGGGAADAGGGAGGDPRARPVTAVTLHTLTSNHAARALYEGAGFRALAVLPSHYFFAGRFHDAVFLRRELGPEDAGGGPGEGARAYFLPRTGVEGQGMLAWAWRQVLVFWRGLWTVPPPTPGPGSGGAATAAASVFSGGGEV
jgi:ribosomal protein S18 acetylase RimI-like enzyme